MANAIYPKFKEQALQAGVNLSSADVKCVLLNTSGTGTLYVYSATHEFLSDVPADARIAISAALTGKTFTNGVFKASNSSFTAVTGDISEAVAFFVDTGNPATSRLIAFVDTGITGSPVTPNGGDINVNFDTGANGIFAL